MHTAVTVVFVIGLLAALALVASYLMEEHNDSRSHHSRSRSRSCSRSRSRSRSNSPSRCRLRAPCVDVVDVTATTVVLHLRDRDCKATSFEVHYRRACDHNWLSLTYNLPANQHEMDVVVSGLEPNTLYAFKARALATDCCGEWACVKSKTACEPPAPPFQGPLSLDKGAASGKVKGMCKAPVAEGKARSASKPASKPSQQSGVTKIIARGRDALTAGLPPRAKGRAKLFGTAIPAPTAVENGVGLTTASIDVTFSNVTTDRPDQVQLQYIKVPASGTPPDLYTWTVLSKPNTTSGFSGTENFSVTGLDSDTPYAFRARCIGYNRDPSPFSTVIYVRTLIDNTTPTDATPNQPTNLAVTDATTNSLTFSFVPDASTVGDNTVTYQVQYADASSGYGTWIQIDLPFASSSPATFTLPAPSGSPLDPNTTHLVRIRAVKIGTQTSPFSSPIFAVTDVSFTDLLSKPEVEVLNVTEQKIFLRITHASDVGVKPPSHYQIQWDKDADLQTLDWNVVTLPFDGTVSVQEYVIDDLKQSSNYGVRVRAIAGTDYAPSSFRDYQVSTGTDTGIAGVVLGAPNVVITDVTSTTAVLNITPNASDPVSQPATSFDVQYVTGSIWDLANFVKVVGSDNYTLGQPPTSALIPASTYYVRVRTVGVGSTGPLYGPYTVLYQFETAPAPLVSTLGSITVTNTSVTDTTATFLISNLPSPAPDAYIWQVREQGSGSPDPVIQSSQSGVSGPSILVPLTGLVAPEGKTYQLWVIGIKSGYNPTPTTYCPFATATSAFGAP
jgi:hypothetical protein